MYIKEGEIKVFSSDKRNKNTQNTTKKKKKKNDRKLINSSMAMSGTYVTDVPLKGSAEKHYKRWRSENHLAPDAIGHLIQGVTVHEGDWDSHGTIKIWNYTRGPYLYFSPLHIMTQI